MVSEEEDHNNDDEHVKEFLQVGCGCLKWNGKQCCKQFTLEHVTEIRMGMLELLSKELDLILMGQIMANNNTSVSVNTENRHESTTRTKAYTFHFLQGKPICRKMFLFLHSIGKNCLKNVIKTVQTHGITPRVHGNTKRLPMKTLYHFSKLSMLFNSC